MFKSATNQTNINPIDSNPITQFFEIGKLTACAGPELVWKIHDAFRKSDGKVDDKDNKNTRNKFSTRATDDFDMLTQFSFSSLLFF